MSNESKEVIPHLVIKGNNPYEIVDVQGELTVFYRGKNNEPCRLDTKHDNCRNILLDALKLWEEIPAWEKPKYLPWYRYDGKKGLTYREDY